MNSKLKVANIIEEGRIGGPQIRIIEVAKHLQSKGIETIVIFPKLDGESFKTKLEKNNIAYIQAPLHKLTRNKWHLMRYILFFFYEVIWITRLFKQEKFDLIHCSGGSWQYKGIIAGKLAHIKTVWHLNDTMTPKIIHIIFRRVAFFCADNFIVAAKCVYQYYLGSNLTVDKPIYEIQAPVDTRKFNPATVIPNKQLNDIPGIIIVSVGNINSTKGFEIFIKMAHLLNKKFELLHFFIVGSTLSSQVQTIENLNILKKTLNVKNLHFYGACNDISSVLKAADIYVCTSYSEASPLTVWEAMSMQKAIVSTDVGDVARFIQNGTNGFIVPTGESEALANKVTSLIENPILAQKFGINARNEAIQSLDIKIITQKHYECYHKILSTE